MACRIGKPKRWTKAERAKYGARDRSLMERFLSREKAVEQELVTLLLHLGRKVAERYWERLAEEWPAYWGEIVATLYRYRDEGRLHASEPLRYLARKLVKHVGRRAATETRRDEAALRWGDGEPGEEEGDDDACGRDDRLEGEALSARLAPPTFTSPDLAAEAQEGLALLRARAKELSATDRATLAAEQAVARGEHESLALALGVSKVVARQRRCRLTKALRRLGQSSRKRAQKKSCHVRPVRCP